MDDRKRYRISTTYHDGDHRYDNWPDDESDDIEELRTLAEGDYSFTEEDKHEKFHDKTYCIFDQTNSYAIYMCWTEPFKYNYPLVWIYEEKESEND